MMSGFAGKEIEKACQGIYPLQNTFIRKVKILRAPKFDITKLMEVTQPPILLTPTSIIDLPMTHERPKKSMHC